MRAVTPPAHDATAPEARRLPPEEFDLKELSLHGHRVAYRCAGSGPAIVLVHGITSTSATWERVLPYLATRFTVIQIRQRYPGHARQALHIAAACQGGAYAGKWTVVVDEDIDAGELDQVLWAMCTRFDPNVDIDIIQKAWASKRDPLFLPGNFNNRMLVDACIPYDMKLKGTFPTVVDVSSDLRAKLRAKFPHIFPPL